MRRIKLIWFALGLALGYAIYWLPLIAKQPEPKLEATLRIVEPAENGQDQPSGELGRSATLAGELLYDCGGRDFQIASVPGGRPHFVYFPLSQENSGSVECVLSRLVADDFEFEFAIIDPLQPPLDWGP